MKTLNRPKILVTGGAGFIGSHTVVELWNAGYEPIIIDNFSNSKPWMIGRIRQLTCPGIELYDVDCTNYEAVAEVVKMEGSILGIIHFAAFKSVSESMSDPNRYMWNNMESLKVMITIKKDFQIPDFVFSSSATVYGSPDALPVDETFQRQKAESVYGLTKQLGENMLLEELETGGAILRYFNPIGAHESGLIGELPNGVPQNLIPFVTQTAAGIREKLMVYGTDYPTEDGTAVRDYIHVVDLAKAHVAALMHLCAARKTDIFNIGTGSGTSVQEVIDAFEEVTGQTLPVEYTDRREGDVAAIYADCSKAEKLLNWKAERTVADALRDAWNWQQAYAMMEKAA